MTKNEKEEYQSFIIIKVSTISQRSHVGNTNSFQEQILSAQSKRVS